MPVVALCSSPVHRPVHSVAVELFRAARLHCAVVPCCCAAPGGLPNRSCAPSRRYLSGDANSARVALTSARASALWCSVGRWWSAGQMRRSTEHSAVPCSPSVPSRPLSAAAARRSERRPAPSRDYRQLTPAYGGPATIRRPGEQAYVSAQQPAPRQDARLPAAHAHPSRPVDPGRPPAQGSRQPIRLTSRVLPPAARLRRREDYTAVLRHGRRSGRGALVVHLLASSPPASVARVGTGGVDVPRVGLVVSKGVGNSVRRHEVSRRLRHLMRGRLERLAGSDRVVLRALPSAAGRSSADLGADLDRALTRLGVR